MFVASNYPGLRRLRDLVANICSCNLQQSRASCHGSCGLVWNRYNGYAEALCDRVSKLSLAALAIDHPRDRRGCARAVSPDSCPTECFDPPLQAMSLSDNDRLRSDLSALVAGAAPYSHLPRDRRSRTPAKAGRQKRRRSLVALAEFGAPEPSLAWSTTGKLGRRLIGSATGGGDRAVPTARMSSEPATGSRSPRPTGDRLSRRPAGCDALLTAPQERFSVGYSDVVASVSRTLVARLTPG
jgi:hypothetical protein